MTLIGSIKLGYPATQRPGKIVAAPMIMGRKGLIAYSNCTKLWTIGARRAEYIYTYIAHGDIYFSGGYFYESLSTLVAYSFGDLSL